MYVQHMVDAISNTYKTFIEYRVNIASVRILNIAVGH